MSRTRTILSEELPHSHTNLHWMHTTNTEHKNTPYSLKVKVQFSLWFRRPASKGRLFPLFSRRSRVRSHEWLLLNFNHNLLVDLDKKWNGRPVTTGMFALRRLYVLQSYALYCEHWIFYIRHDSLVLLMKGYYFYY